MSTKFPSVEDTIWGLRNWFNGDVISGVIKLKVPLIDGGTICCLFFGFEAGDLFLLVSSAKLSYHGVCLVDFLWNIQQLE